MGAVDFRVIELCTNGAYNANRYLDRDCRCDKERVIAESNPAIELEIHTDCGIITFPDPVNSENLPIGNLIEYLNKNFYQWVVGNFIHGTYCKMGRTFDESALSVEIAGISSAQLMETAKRLCDLYDQPCALVKDCSANELFLLTH